MRSKTIFLPQIGYEAGGSSKEIVVSGRLRYRVDPMGKERGIAYHESIMRSKTIFLPQIGYEAGGSSKEIVVSGRLRYRVDPMGKERGIIC